MSAAIWGSDAMMSLNAWADATIRIPYRPIPRPHAIATPVRSASWRLNGPAIADRQRRQPEPADVRDAAEIAPLEGDDADREQDERRRRQGPRPTASR